MLLKEITLENFRQFINTQKMEFEEKDGKSITVVLGDNGLGKTTLNQAFLFALYGIKKIKFEDFTFTGSNSYEILKLANNEIKKKKQDFTMSVALSFEHANYDYKIKRSYDFFWLNNTNEYSVSGEDFDAQKNDKNSSKGIQNCTQIEIANILPSPLADLFFFDGERMNKLAMPSSKTVLAKNVIDLLSLSTLWETLCLLKRTKHSAISSTSTKTVEQQIKNELKSDDNNAIDLNKRITEKIELVAENGKKLNDNLERINQIELRLDGISKEIIKLATDKECQKRRYALEKSNKSLEENIETSRNDILKQFTKGYISLFFEKNKDFLNESLANSDLKDKTIPGIQGPAIDAIIKNGKCLCGCDLNENPTAIENLKKWKEIIPPKELSSLLMDLNKQCEISEDESNNFKSFFEAKRRNIYKMRNEIIGNEDEIKKISYDNSNIVELASLENEKTTLENEKKELEYANWSLNKDNDNYNKIIDSLNKELHEITEHKNINNKVYKKLALLDSIYDYLLKKSEHKEALARQKLQEKATTNYENMLSKDYRIKINSDYSYDVFDTDELTKTNALSEGERVITSFSFIGSLVSTAREVNSGVTIKDGQTLPLVMDAPFAKVDNTCRKNVAHLLPSFSNQLIIFSIDSQWEGAISNELENKVNTMYQLQYEDSIHSTVIKKIERK